MTPHVVGRPVVLTSAQIVMLCAVLTGVAVGLVPRFTTDLNPTGDAKAMDLVQVETAARAYIGEWQPLADPLVTLDNGTQVKSSNVNGFEIDGVRYYYRPVYGFSADPVSRDQSKRHQVVLVINAGTEWETEIYRIPD